MCKVQTHKSSFYHLIVIVVPILPLLPNVVRANSTGAFVEGQTTELLAQK